MSLARTLLYDLPARIARPLAPLAPLAARFAVGWVFMQTGWGKLHSLDKVIEYFASLGIPYPELQAPFVASVELVGGAMLLAGLLTRIVAVPLAFTMVVAIATALWPNVEDLAGFLGLVELLYIVLFAWLAIAGPGPISLDALIERWLGAEGAPARTPGFAPKH